MHDLTLNIPTKQYRALSQAIEEAMSLSIREEEEVYMDYVPDLADALFEVPDGYDESEDRYWGTDWDGNSWEIVIGD